jgi:plasmid stabilization system protein ParE
MDFKIDWSDDALTHLQELIDYLRDEAGELTVTKITSKITRRIDLLATQPEFGQREPLLEGKRHEYRRLIEGRYKIIYRVEGDTVYISAIFDTRQNPDRLRGLFD